MSTAIMQSLTFTMFKMLEKIATLHTYGHSAGRPNTNYDVDSKLFLRVKNMKENAFNISEVNCV